MIKVQVVVKRAAGLHARPAAVIARKASGFTSKISLLANEKAADAKSLLAIMGMGITQGTEITLMADGADEKECIAALSPLITAME